MSETEEGKRQKSSFFLVKTKARQEQNVAMLIEKRVRSQNLDVYSIIIQPEMKGYIIIEAQKSSIVDLATRDLPNVGKRVQGILSLEDVERAIKPKEVIEGLNPGDMVEVIAGPLQGIKAQVVQVDREKKELVLNILESAYPLKITVSGDYVKPIKKGSSYE
ncbi:MAG: transcription elongation factor Spt5 [Fervidicoccaceae archaeon]